MYKNRRYYLLLVLLWLFTISLPAQNTATVKSFSETIDHIPLSERRSDLNGTPCALIKVQVLDDIERVEGNKIGSIVNKGVEKWIYMCKGSRNIRIHFKNHLPVRVMFQDYKISGLESNRVYELIINVPSESGGIATSTAKSGDFRLSVNPANAVVVVWGDGSPRKTYHPSSDGALAIWLPYGRYYYEVRADGYYKQEGNIFISDNPVVESFTLQHTQEWIDAQKRMEEQRQAEERQKEDLRRMEELRKMAIADSIARAKEDSIKAVQDSIKAAQDSIRAAQEAARKAEQDSIRAAEAAKRALIKKQKHDELMSKLGELEKKTVVLGVKAGYNMATAQFDSKYKGTTGSIGGFHIGVTTDVRLTDVFHFCSGLIYSAKGYTYENNSNDVDEEGKAQFVDIPLQASLRLPLGNTVKLTVNAGPYAAICVGGKVNDKWANLEETFSTAYSGFDYGVQAGVGLIISHHIQIGADYQLGMGSSYRNRNLMVGLGYRF